MSNRDYLEQYAHKIGAYAYDEAIKPLVERIDVESAIRLSLEEREALYMALNGIKPNIANYWLLPEAQQKRVRMEMNKR